MKKPAPANSTLKLAAALAAFSFAGLLAASAQPAASPAPPAPDSRAKAGRQSKEPARKQQRTDAKSAAPKAPRVPPGVTAHRDIAYVPGGHERQQLDLYLPENPSASPLAKDGRLPLIIWIHGGGWRNGSKAACFPLARQFSARGYAIASIGYRLSDTAKFPAQIEDCKAAVRWLRANAARHGIDPDRFVAWGSSAGGHLVALLGTAGGERAFDKGPNPGVSSAVQVVIDYYGPADFCDKGIAAADAARLANATSAITLLLGVSPLEDRAKAAAASPVSYVSKNTPPMFILHGTDDKSVPISQSRILHDSLKKAGADAKLKVIEGAGHGGPKFSAKETLDEIDAFIKAHLK